MKYLIVGLGNPGPEYELTRHNIGFLTLDRLAEQQGCTFRPDRLAEVADFKYKGRSIHLIKPSTYMNLSGKAVNYWLQSFKVAKENLLVVVDDIALPFGTLRLRAKGSSAGHNGLKNIEDLSGGQDYARLRMGVGKRFRPRPAGRLRAQSVSTRRTRCASGAHGPSGRNGAVVCHAGNCPNDESV